MATYKILRFYQASDTPSETVTTGLTFAEAQRHCDDPETSSDTCTSEEGKKRTSEEGTWFEGYTKEQS